MVKILVEIEASPTRAIEIISNAIYERNKVLRKAVPDASVFYEVLGVCTHHDEPNRTIGTEER
jgi:hypothetical protein